MTSRLRKFMLTIHITCSVGWIGAALTYLALVVVAMTNEDEQILRAVWIALASTGWFAIVPLSLASLFTGLIMSLGTKWGLFRYYWVIFSFVLTIFATIILLQHMQTVSLVASTAIEAGGVDGLQSGLNSELLHAGVGLLLLLVIQVLNVYKPQGMTSYGWRKQQAQRAERQT